MSGTASLYMYKGTEGLFSEVHGCLLEASGGKLNNRTEYQEALPYVGRAYPLRDTACLALGVSLSCFGAATTTGGTAAGCSESSISVSADLQALCPLKLKGASFFSSIPA